MLLQFTVHNFASFKEEAVFSLLADGAKDHMESLIHFRKERILPAIAIYGANASGKSNLIQAVATAVRMITTSHQLQEGDKLPYTPFMLDREGMKKPTSFSFIFTGVGSDRTKEQVMYEYSFSYNANQILTEKLLEYKSSRPSLVFERTETNQYRFTQPKVAKELKPLVDRNSINKLFLSTAAAWNAKSVKPAFLWFRDKIQVATLKGLTEIFLQKMNRNEMGDYKEFVLKLLKRADIPIEDFECSSEPLTGSDVEIMISPGIHLDEDLLRTFLHKGKKCQFKTVHKVKVDGKQESISIPIDLESRGTKTIMAYASFLYDAQKQGKTVFVDGLEQSLHPELLTLLVRHFMDLEININHAQLIFATHDVVQLNLDLFRRDQIVFVEKDRNSAASSIYSLADFVPRKAENVQKSYLADRYGAVPSVQKVLLD